MAHHYKLPVNFLALYRREIDLIGQETGRFPVELDTGEFVTLETIQRGNDRVTRPGSIGDAIRIRKIAEGAR